MLKLLLGHKNAGRSLSICTRQRFLERRYSCYGVEGHWILVVCMHPNLPSYEGQGGHGWGQTSLTVARFELKREWERNPKIPIFHSEMLFSPYVCVFHRIICLVAKPRDISGEKQTYQYLDMLDAKEGRRGKEGKEEEAGRRGQDRRSNRNRRRKRKKTDSIFICSCWEHSGNLINFHLLPFWCCNLSRGSCSSEIISGSWENFRENKIGIGLLRKLTNEEIKNGIFFFKILILI